jgi:hypothetical protein
MYGGFYVITSAVVSFTISSNIPKQGKCVVVSFLEKIRKGVASAAGLYSMCLDLDLGEGMGIICVLGNQVKWMQPTEIPWLIFSRYSISHAR